VNDDAYMWKNIEEGAVLGGYNSGHAVWISSDLAGRITHFGDFAHEGDVVEVTGVFNAACREPRRRHGHSRSRASGRACRPRGCPPGSELARRVGSRDGCRGGACVPRAPPRATPLRLSTLHGRPLHGAETARASRRLTARLPLRASARSRARGGARDEVHSLTVGQGIRPFTKRRGIVPCEPSRRSPRTRVPPPRSPRG